jgi:DNA-binding HxlR family transcriptional regulator
MCPKYERAIEILGKRWTGLILRALMDEPRRFSEIIRYVDGLSDRLLSQRLQELEAEGIVERTVYDDRPVVIEYKLTEKGHALKSVVEAVQHWANEWDPTPAASREAAATPNRP